MKMAYRTIKTAGTAVSTSTGPSATMTAPPSFKIPATPLSGTKGQSFPTAKPGKSSSTASSATKGGKVKYPIPSTSTGTTTLFDSRGLTVDISRKKFVPLDNDIRRSQSTPPTKITSSSSSYLKKEQKFENKSSSSANINPSPSSAKMWEYFSNRQTHRRSISSAPKLNDFDQLNEGHDHIDHNSVEVSNTKGPASHSFGGTSESSFAIVKRRKPTFPLSETRGSFQARSALSSSSVHNPRNPSAYKSASLSTIAPYGRTGGGSNTREQFTHCNYGRKQRSEDNLIASSLSPAPSSKLGRNYDCDDKIKMKTARSELSLTEQKRIQWAKEKEELNGLWSPWGRHSEAATTVNINNLINNSKQGQPQSPTAASAQMMQASYPSPTNVVSSSYVANLGLGPQTYSQQSHSSECYLPPINSTIAQQPRQKAKVWNNAEFQTEDYRYENGGDPPHSHQGDPNDSNHRNSIPISNHPNRGIVHPNQRKASLPNYAMHDDGGGGDGHHNNSYHHHKLNNGQGDPTSSWGPVSLEEERFTSDYYSGENNNYGNGEDLGGGTASGSGSTSKREVILKPTSRERSYQEEVTVQKAIAVRKRDQNGNSPGRMMTHKIYTQNGEVFAEHEGMMMMNNEVVVNSMTVGGNGRGGGVSSGRGHVSVQRQYENSKSPTNPLPRNHAMRSSLTIGVDASTVDAYYENDRRQKEQWLNELEKQRDEQRLRKMMEKEDRRPRWGDRGIGVGHFWEPSDSENSHLPAPPHTSRKGDQASSLTRSESHAGGEGYMQHYPHQQFQHPGQSHTPPAWLERSLTRMQSSKSQPSLHDPEYIRELEYSLEGNEGNRDDTGGGHHLNHSQQNLGSSRSLNHSAMDLRNGAGYASPTGDSDRTFIRGQNVPIDPDTLNEREKKRQANQEHLEALKKQIEERQQQQKEEKERRQQEEREQEMRMAKQREMELQRLEMEKRGRMPVNGDMPNCIEESANNSEAPGHSQDAPNTKNSKISTMMEQRERATTNPLRDPSEEKDIEIVQRQSVMVGGNRGGPGEDDKMTESSSSSINHHHQHQLRLSRQDQSVMTDTSDPNFERTLTPSIQRSRSLSLNRASREFGTQTELSDGSSSCGNSSSEADKNSNKNRSHNSLLDKKAKECKKELERKKSEERPRWGSNPVKKQYIKQSEKDPNYISRMKRRQERLKRMEEERSARGDTGTESEDVSIPFHRIRQRRISEVSPKKMKGIVPLKAITSFLAGKTDKQTGSSVEAPQQKQDEATSTSPRRSNKGRWKALINGAKNGDGNNTPRQRLLPGIHPMKNAKSESHLNQQASGADILDRNFGSIAGINGVGTSEESSGFSTPFLPRRDHLGSGSTETSGSGTTGSGSGIQSPDLAYHSHAYQATKANREERKYTKMNSGRDTHSIGNISGRKVRNGGGNKEFTSPQKGFIDQHEFDEMPVKASKPPSFMEEMANIQEEERKDDLVKVGKKVSTATIKRQQRNRSLSPTRKLKAPSSPVKVSQGKGGGKDDKRKVSSEAPAELTPRSSEQNNILPHRLTTPPRPTSPPVPALLKKLQMGLQPDETGRISSLPTEFPDILGPLPSIPIRLLSPINPPSSRMSSATSGASSTSAAKIDIDIAVMPRRSPEIMRLFEAAEENLKQRQLTAIMTSGIGGNDSAKSRRSFEADIGNISINLEPLVLYPRDHPYHGDGDGVDKYEFDIPTMNSARVSIRSTPRQAQTARSENEVARHEAFITSILNRKEVKDQLSARESELSEKGIIEFSIRLPSNSSGDDILEEYKDPLLTERRRNTAQWLYGGQGQATPQKQAILTNLATLKKGLSLQEEWKVRNSDTE